MPTIIASIIVFGLLFLAGYILYRQIKSGKGCGGCSGCAHAKECQSVKTHPHQDAEHHIK